MKNKVCVLLLILFFNVLFVSAENHSSSENEIDDMIKEFDEIDFTKDDAVISDELLKKINDNKEAFIAKFGEKFKVPLKFDGDVTKIDSNGNLVLSGGTEVSLNDIRDYANNWRGDAGDETYTSQGVEHNIATPILSGVEVDSDGVTTYSFKPAEGDPIEVKVGGGARYDLSNHKIVLSDGGDVNLKNGVRGGFTVDGNKISSEITVVEGDTKLDRFVILERDGVEFSPRQRRVYDVKAPGDIDFSSIAEGNFRLFESGGKKYSVDSEGAVREILDFSFEGNEDGAVNIENAYISGEDFGEVFVTGEAYVYFGDDFPEVVDSGNHIFISDPDAGGKVDVSIQAMDGRIVYRMNGDLGTLNLKGDVWIVNGGTIVRSDLTGRLKFLKLDKEGKFEFLVDKFYNVDRPKNTYGIRDGDTIYDLMGFGFIDISKLQSGTGGGNVKANPTFQRLTTGLTRNNRYSVRQAVERNLRRLGLAGNDENIAFLTEQIMEARAIFSERELIGSETQRVIFMAHSEDGGSRFNPDGEIVREFFLKTGVDSNNVLQFNGGGGRDVRGALSALETSTGQVTMVMSGHGWAGGFSNGGSSVRINHETRGLVDSLLRRNLAGEPLSNVFISCGSCVSYDFMQSIHTQLLKRGATDLPMLYSEGSPGVATHTEYGYFGNDEQFAAQYKANLAARPPGGVAAFTGSHVFASENPGRDNPSVRVPIFVTNPDGSRRLMSLEIS